MKPILANLSIRRKQTLIMMATSTAALLLAGGALSAYELISFRHGMVQNLATLADLVDDGAALALHFNDAASAETNLAAFQTDPGIVGACIYTKSGEVFAKYDRTNDDIIFTPPALRTNGCTFAGQRVIFSRPISYHGEPVGAVYLESDMSGLIARLTRYAAIAGPVFVLSLLLAFVLSVRLQRVVSEPIRHLAGVARSVAVEKNYGLRASKQSNDELGQLVDGFNAMLAQIQERDAALQAARHSLEMRVQERTAELAAANQSLLVEIEERKRTEEELRFQSVILSTQQEVSMDGILVVDENGVVLSHNQRFVELWGVPAELIVQKADQPLLNFVLNQLADAPSFLQRVQYLYEHRRETSQEEILLKDGRVFDRYSAPMFGGNDRYYGRVWYFRDITGRKRAEEKLKLFRTLIERSSDGILVMDPATGRFLDANESACQALGYTRDELLALTLFDVTVGVSRAVFEASNAKIEEKGHDTLEALHRRKDGTTYPAEASLSLVMLHRKYVVVIVRDITERKRAQIETQNLHQQLVESSRLAGMAEIATNVLHNVGNALNSVNISTDLIVEGVRKSSASSLARISALLQEHARDLGEFIMHDPNGRHVPAHLARLSEHLLAEQAIITRELESLRRNVEHIKDVVAMQQNYALVGGVKEKTDLIGLVEDSLRLNEDALRRHGVEVIRELEDVPPMIVEKHKILQILVNLVRNAKYACDESGRADRHLTVRLANGDGRLRISVIDDGIGIPPENLTRIFNHGFTTRKGGHGFGLHSSALAAREMGGSLTVQSNGPGQGAAFTLELPCPEPENAHE